jgi:hypothetical protein
MTGWSINHDRNMLVKNAAQTLPFNCTLPFAEDANGRSQFPGKTTVAFAQTLAICHNWSVSYAVY